jgi:hypothetical protein
VTEIEPGFGYAIDLVLDRIDDLGEDQRYVVALSGVQRSYPFFQRAQAHHPPSWAPAAAVTNALRFAWRIWGRATDNHRLERDRVLSALEAADPAEDHDGEAWLYAFNVALPDLLHAPDNPYPLAAIHEASTCAFDLAVDGWMTTFIDSEQTPFIDATIQTAYTTSAAYLHELATLIRQVEWLEHTPLTQTLVDEIRTDAHDAGLHLQAIIDRWQTMRGSHPHGRQSHGVVAPAGDT